MSEPDLFQTIDVEKALRINEDNLEREMSTCATYFFHYSMLAADAEQMEESMKLSRQAYEATLAVTLKKADAKGVMKEADLHRACYVDTAWQGINRKELNHHSNVKKLKAIAGAFEMKSRMLMSMNRRSVFKESQGLSGGTPYKDD